MYQAIVFLPLLGFLIAAAIAMIGARARCPGEDPAPGEDHAAPYAHDTSIAHASGVIHESHQKSDEHAPEAWSSREAEIIPTALLSIAMVLSWIALYRVGFGAHDERIPLMSWVISGALKVDWSLRIDTLTAVMLVV